VCGGEGGGAGGLTLARHGYPHLVFYKTRTYSIRVAFELKVEDVNETHIVSFSAACVDLVGSYSMSLIRAMLTCCVPLSEFGKIFSVLSALDNLLPIGLTQAYATVWKVRIIFCC
jgi:hypothetical protein